MTSSALRRPGDPRLATLLPILAVVFVWALLQFLFIWGGITPILKGEFPDGDGYERLIRVMHLVDTGDWYDGSLPRSNWPFGETMNWTRPLDVLLLAGAFLLRPFMNLHDALFWFGSAQSPLCALAAAFAASWMAKPILGPKPHYEIMLLFLLQPGVLNYTDAGRADHHGIQILCFVLAFGFAMRALARPDKSHDAFFAGALIAVGLWISTEFLATLLATLAAFGILWLRDGERWVRLNRLHALGFAVGVAAALPLERSPVSGLLVEEHDRISIVHLVLAVLILAFWVLAPFAARYLKGALGMRAALAAAGAAVASATMFALYPRFFAGPLGAVDPAIFPIWFSRIMEWQPVLPTSLAGIGRSLFWYGSAVISMPWVACAAWKKRRDSVGPNWLLVALALALFTVLTMRGVRFARYAEIASLIPLVCMVNWTSERAAKFRGWRKSLLTAAAVTVIAVGMPIAGAFMIGAAAGHGSASANQACHISDIAPILSDTSGLGSQRQVVVANIDSGPEIMYRTPHDVLATPMHRNVGGILATYRLMTAADDETAKKIIDDREVSLILLCPFSGERKFFASDQGEDTFYNRLVDGKLPDWLRPVALPDAAAREFRLFAVVAGPA